MAEHIRFYYRSAVQTVENAAPTRTVLQHLREDLHCTGTKEGCAEGDCGACTIVLGELKDDRLEFKTVNSCIQFVPTLDGKAVFTVEDLAPSGENLHPVQQAMVDCHASQCGFCTPGFVMSLWNLYLQHASGEPPTRREIDDALSGNLCRCTGYRPIIDAAHRMFDLPQAAFEQAGIIEALRSLQRTDSFTYAAGDRAFHIPRSLDDALALRAAHPDACLLAGSTDVGLWVTKQMRDLGDIIYLGHVDALKRIDEKDDCLEIGAAVSLNDAYRTVCAHYPAELSELWQRFASLPIRHAGTLGGNVANGSPIGDSMPWLIALGATVVLRSTAGQRVLALEDFYLGYQKKDLRPDELVEAVRIPLPRPGLQFRTYKLSKRFDQDISAVCAAFSLVLRDGAVSEARIVFGGMAATPKRATHAETVLNDRAWDETALKAAMQAMEQDYSPLSDMRASGDYRRKAAQNLLRRFWLETRPENPLPAEAVNVFAKTTAGGI